MDPPFSETNTFKITIVNSCTADTTTLITDTGENTFPASDYTYYIGERTDNFLYDGVNAFTYSATKPFTHQRYHASWMTKVPYCPLDFELMKDNGSGTYVALTAAEANVVTLINKMPISVRSTCTGHT